MGGGGRLTACDPHHVVQAPLAGLAQDRLGPVVEVARVELVAMLLGIDLAPAGQCPRDLADVALGVMPLAQGEELEELAREVLVGLDLRAIQAIEPAAHGTVAEHPAVQLADRCPPQRALGAVLIEHQLGRVDLGLAGGVVAVPGQGHDLGQRKRREDQPVEPEHLHPLHGRPAPGRLLHDGDRCRRIPTADWPLGPCGSPSRMRRSEGSNPSRRSRSSWPQVAPKPARRCR